MQSNLNLKKSSLINDSLKYMIEPYNIKSFNKENETDIIIELNNGQVFGISVDVLNGSPYIYSTELIPEGVR